MKNLPLYQQISTDIQNDICTGLLMPGERISSESELTEKYRVSSITAKNAMAELVDQGFIVRIKGKGSFVSSQTELDRIEKYIQSRYDRTHVSVKAIGLILPTMKTKVDQELLNAIEHEIAETPYVMLLNITRESQAKESAAIQQFINNGVSGLIIFPTETEIFNEDIIKLSIEKFPFVFIDRYLKGLNANSVTTNNTAVTKAAVNKMINNKGGHIAFISPNSSNSVTSERIQGFEDALLDNNIPLNRSCYCMVDLALTTREEKYSCIKSFLDQTKNLDGIFCANQEMAELVMNVLEDFYPDLISNLQLFCFDGITNSHFSYIHQNISQIAKASIQILLSAIQGKTELSQIIVPAELFERDQ